MSDMTLKNCGCDTVSLRVYNSHLFASNLLIAGGGYGALVACSKFFAVNSEVETELMFSFFAID